MNVNINGIEYAPKAPICSGHHRLGPLLKVTRKSIGYSLDEAARHIGTSKSYIWELENGRCEPSLRVAANIASAYGMRVETLAAALTPNVK